MLKKLTLAIAITFASIRALPESTVSIGNFPNAPSISRQEVVWYYTLRYKTWPDGNAVKIVLLPDTSPEHSDFVRSVLGMSSTQYRRLIDAAINSGAGTNLIRAKGTSDMVMIIETTPYTLGYISKDYLVLRGADSSVKILRITD